MTRILWIRLGVSVTRPGTQVTVVQVGKSIDSAIEPLVSSSNPTGGDLVVWPGILPEQSVLVIKPRRTSALLVIFLIFQVYLRPTVPCINMDLVLTVLHVLSHHMDPDLQVKKSTWQTWTHWKLLKNGKLRVVDHPGLRVVDCSTVLLW